MIQGMIDIKFNLRRYFLFLLLFILPIINKIRRARERELSVFDSIIFIFIPLFLIIFLSYFPWPIPKLKDTLSDYKDTIKTKNTFYFIRFISGIIGNSNYYLFCGGISIIALILSIFNQFKTLPTTLSLEDLRILYGLISGSISIFLGLAFWKPVTEEFSNTVKKFYCQLTEDMSKLTDIDTSRAKWSLFFHVIMFDDFFVLVWGVFWSFLVITWSKATSIEAVMLGLQYFVQSTTISISAFTIFALFLIGLVSHIFEIDETTIYQRNFGDFFEKLRDTVMKVAVMQLLVPGLIMPTILIIPDIPEQYPTQVFIGWFWFIVGQIIILIFGIFGAHNAMKRLKQRKKREITNKIKEKRKHLEGTTVDSISYVTTSLDYNMLILQYESLESISTWPISPKGWVGLLVGTIINYILDYMIKILARARHLMQGKASSGIKKKARARVRIPPPAFYF